MNYNDYKKQVTNTSQACKTKIIGKALERFNIILNENIKSGIDASEIYIDLERAARDCFIDRDVVDNDLAEQVQKELSLLGYKSRVKVRPDYGDPLACHQIVVELSEKFDDADCIASDASNTKLERLKHLAKEPFSYLNMIVVTVAYLIAVVIGFNVPDERNTISTGGMLFIMIYWLLHTAVLTTIGIIDLIKEIKCEKK